MGYTDKKRIRILAYLCLLSVALNAQSSHKPPDMVTQQNKTYRITMSKNREYAEKWKVPVARVNCPERAITILASRPPRAGFRMEESILSTPMTSPMRSSANTPVSVTPMSIIHGSYGRTATPMSIIHGSYGRTAGMPSASSSHQMTIRDGQPPLPMPDMPLMQDMPKAFRVSSRRTTFRSMTRW